VPALPEPRAGHTVCALGDGRVVAAGGGEGLERTALQWVPGAAGWAPLPDMAERRDGAAVVALPDGRAMVIGGWDGDGQYLASAGVLAADGSGWSGLAPMGTARWGPAAAVLPCGKVLAAGGERIVDDDEHTTFNTAELWDPVTRAWSDLPPMEYERSAASGCILSSGRVAVVGGYNNDGPGGLRDGEVFDPETQTWQFLPAMQHGRYGHGVVAVADSLLAMGGAFGNPLDELFDEASGRWFELPHPMAEPRSSFTAVSLPVSALSLPAAAAAGAAAQ